MERRSILAFPFVAVCASIFSSTNESQVKKPTYFWINGIPIEHGIDYRYVSIDINRLHNIKDPFGNHFNGQIKFKGVDSRSAVSFEREFILRRNPTLDIRSGKQVHRFDLSLSSFNLETINDFTIYFNSRNIQKIV